MTKFVYKKLASILLAAIIIFSATSSAFAVQAQGDTIILYTNDVHCAIDDYAVFAAYRAELIENGNDVITVDAGDAIQGEIIGRLTTGEVGVNLMNSIGYDYAVPGNHEFDYGMDRFLELAKTKAQYEYLSCNFKDLRNGLAVLTPYAIEEIDGQSIAFIGISTPETLTKSTPEYFKDSTGNYIYGFPGINMQDGVFADCIQDTIDKAKQDGADVIVAIGHTGIAETTDGWKSTDIIAQTSGIDVFLDAHSHEIIVGDTYKDKNNDDVLLSSTGTKFSFFGQLTIKADGTLESELIDPDSIDVTTFSQSAQDTYNDIGELVDSYNAQLDSLEDPVGTSEANLVVYNEDKTWRVRQAETNMGNFVTDAYLYGSDGADIAISNSGGIRAGINVGSVSQKDLMNINPYGNEMCTIKATGQEILDALEHGAAKYPEPSGGFLQVSSSLTFDIEAWKDSPVVTDANGNFLFVDTTKERRVTNVLYNGQPLDPNGTYVVAGTKYVLLEGGDGYTMFRGKSTAVATNKLDYELLIEYFIEELDGKITAEQYGSPDGDGRINIIKENPADTCSHWCHRDGILQYIWVVVRFFCDIFGIFPTCDCGLAHY